MSAAVAEAAKRPLVTISLKAYNQAASIGPAVAAVLAQTYAPLEVILSDDCSTDGTFAVMRRLAEAYDGPHRVVLNRNPSNLGIVGHLNRIAQLASGRLLVDASGDDVSMPTRAARAVEAWTAAPGRVKAVHSRFIETDADDRAIRDAGPPEVIVDRPGPTPLAIVQSGANCNGATAAWDLELFERFGPIPAYCRVSDGPLFFRAALLDGVVFLDEPLVRYRTGGVSRRRPRSPGFDYLYGDRIKFARWRVTNARSFLSDLETVDFPDRDACRRICEQIIERVGFEVDLADRGALSRLTVLPRAIARSARSGDRYFAAQSVKHALGPAFVALYNLRHEAPRPSSPDPSAARSGHRGC